MNLLTGSRPVQTNSLGSWILAIAYIAFCIGDMMLQVNEDLSSPIKIIAFGLLALALLYRPRFHRLIWLLLPLGGVMLVATVRSFNKSAAVEELSRFAFPIAITVTIYAYRTSLRPVIVTFIAVVISNDLFQCYAYAAHVAGLPALITERIDSGLYLRAQGWIGFFSEFSFMNFCAFVLCRRYWITRKSMRASWIFMLFAVLGLSFKLFPVVVAYFIIERKNSFRTVLVVVVGTVTTAAAMVTGLLDKFVDVASTKVLLYIVAGNSARAESYRVLFESFAGGNVFGEGLGSFGGPASVKYNSPLYSSYNFKWYGMDNVLKTTDTFYPHLFVEIGLVGACIWMVFVFLYGQLDRRDATWKFMVVAFAFDNIFSMSLLSASYVFSALLTMYLFSLSRCETSLTQLPTNAGRRGVAKEFLSELSARTV
ncbi:MAG: hypothetical protein P4L81_07740 [Candidatus Pacebacteria bacterium]|nr:hypothetical protein [Candidatus Paceibacterota bacterium]